MRSVVFALLAQLAPEEMMVERDLLVDHATIWRWVQHYAPILNQRLRREVRHPSGSWRVDETYVRVGAEWAYLYRAVDSAGDTIDFLLSPKRDLTAAKLFLRLALSGTSGVRPRVINVDGHPAYARAIAELKQSGDLGRADLGNKLRKYIRAYRGRKPYRFHHWHVSCSFPRQGVS